MPRGASDMKNSNPKRVVINPNWAQLRQKIHPGRPRSSAAGTAAQSSSEAAAEPSVLGKRKERTESEPEGSPAAVLAPTSDDCSLTGTVAMDCEMVGVSSEGTRSALGRVTLVNTWGNVVYDEYVRPVEHVVDFRTRISGIRPRHLKKAKKFWVVQKEVAEIIKGRILVGHALHNDLKVLLLSHPKKDTRDTSEYQKFQRDGRRRALKDLAAQILGIRIQQKEHCPVEDARAAMLIYIKYKKEWEKSIKELLRTKRKLSNKRKKKIVNKQEIPTKSDGLSTNT